MPDSSDPPPSNMAVNIWFLVALAAILSLKAYLYFLSPHTGTGLTAHRAGATVAVLLMWTFAYTMCRRTTAKA